MNLSITSASVEERPVVERLLQLCLHDYSAYDRFSIGDDGAFTYRWTDLYWSSLQRTPYLMRFEGRLAGFALVRESEIRGDWQWQLAEFFILRARRRQGIGTEAARRILASRRGVWEIGYDVANTPARGFWASVLGAFDPAARPAPAGPGRERYLVRSTGQASG